MFVNAFVKSKQHRWSLN